MNRLTKAVIAGALAGTLHVSVMVFKGLSYYAAAAVFLQYLIGSVLIFYAPIRAAGWVKGLIVGTICAFPLMVLIPFNEPAGSVLTGLIVFCFLGIMLGVYGSQCDDKSTGPVPMAVIARAALAGLGAGVICAGLMFIKGMAAGSMAAIIGQCLVGSLLIFFAPLKLTGPIKGVIVMVASGLPIVITVPYYDPYGSAVSALIVLGILGSLIGFYNSYQEKR